MSILIILMGIGFFGSILCCFDGSSRKGVQSAGQKIRAQHARQERAAISGYKKVNRAMAQHHQERVATAAIQSELDAVMADIAALQVQVDAFNKVQAAWPAAVKKFQR